MLSSMDSPPTIQALRYRVVADSRGEVAEIALDPIEGFILALLTAPGTPAPTSPFDIDLLDVRGRAPYDLLEGCGLQRPHGRKSQTLVTYRTARSNHPVVDEGDRLRLRVRGLSPSAAVEVQIIVGARQDAGAIPPEE